MMKIEERIKRYLDAIPPAVQGQGGDTALYKVACALYNGFALSEVKTLEWLTYFNRKCVPPWSGSEKWRLAYKASEAAKASHDNPRGHLLEGNLPSYTPMRLKKGEIGKSIQKGKLAIDAILNPHSLRKDVLNDPIVTQIPCKTIVSARVWENDMASMADGDPLVKAALDLFDGQLRPAESSFPWAMWDKLAEYPGSLNET